MRDDDELMRLMAAKFARKYALLDLKDGLARMRAAKRAARKMKRALAKPGRKKKSDRFLLSQQWRDMRERVFELHGRRCQKCGSCDEIQVDHIKPRSRFPELALDLDNLQVLCWPCNREKNFRMIADYRPSHDAKPIPSCAA